jgi:hypothetical protein
MTRVFITPPGQNTFELALFTNLVTTVSTNDRAGSFSMDVPSTDSDLIHDIVVGSTVEIIQDAMTMHGFVTQPPRALDGPLSVLSLSGVSTTARTQRLLVNESYVDTAISAIVTHLFGAYWPAVNLTEIETCATLLTIDFADKYLWDAMNELAAISGYEWYISAKNDENAGSGTENDPYIIRTASDLANVATYINTDVAGYKTAYYRMDEDIDLSGYANWTPIGSFTSLPITFDGNFNGNGKKIYNLTSSSLYGGLFGVVYGKIYNLGIESGNITSYSIGAGGVCCNLNVGNGLTGEIYGCYNKAIITTSGDYVRAGGIASINGGHIHDCYNAGAITSSASVPMNGGIVGQSVGNGTIVDCYNIGAVSVTNGTAFGGICGQLLDASSVTTSYYLDTSCTQGGTGSTALTMLQMAGINAATYMTGFDFINVWATVINSYPRLKLSTVYAAKILYLQFFDKESSVNETVLSQANHNYAAGTCKISLDSSKLVNRLSVRGGFTQSDLYHQSAVVSATPLLLTFAPVLTVSSGGIISGVRVKVGGLERSVGYAGTDNPGAKDFLFNAQDNLLITDRCPMGSTADISYCYQYPIKMLLEDAASQTAYGIYDGIFELDHSDRDYVRAMAQAHLDKYKTPLITGSITPTEGSYHPGQLIKFEFPSLDIDAFYKISQVQARSLTAQDYVEITLQFEEPEKSIGHILESINKRLKALEALAAAEGTVPTRVVHLTAEVDAHPFIFVSESTICGENTIVSPYPVLSLSTSAGELFRRRPTEIEVTDANTALLTYYLAAGEATGALTAAALYTKGATETLGSGTQLTTQVISQNKKATEPMTVEWALTITAE